MVVKLRVKVTGSLACRLWWGQRLVGVREAEEMSQKGVGGRGWNA